MNEIELGDVVEMQNGTVLSIFMNDCGRLYGVPLPTNFPRFVPDSERIFVSRKKVSKIISKRTEP